MARGFLSFLILSLSLFALPSSDTQKETDSTDLLEFPVFLQQNLEAGKTPAGTIVQAKLTTATLVKGTVVPRDAIFSGVVEESAAKSAQDAPRLAVRMDKVTWKSGSLELRVYLLNWYYPLQRESEAAASDPSAMHGNVSVVFGGGGTVYPPGAQPPADASGRVPDDNSTPATPAVSSHRVQIKDVTATRKEGGQVEITTTGKNLKFNKSTIYVVGTPNLITPK